MYASNLNPYTLISVIFQTFLLQSTNIEICALIIIMYHLILLKQHYDEVAFQIKICHYVIIIINSVISVFSNPLYYDSLLITCLISYQFLFIYVLYSGENPLLSIIMHELFPILILLYPEFNFYLYTTFILGKILLFNLFVQSP